MPGPTLLSRIRHSDAQASRRTATEREERDSILANLVAMCNTRIGTMLTADDYGIATVSEMVYAFPEAIALMASTLKHSIQTYERRLTNVQVVHIPGESVDGLLLRFEVRCRMVGDKRPLKFETTLDASRRMTVR